jgi:hypothetical protein
VGPPRLVNDEGNVAVVTHLGDPLDVGAGEGERADMLALVDHMGMDDRVPRALELCPER